MGWICPVNVRHIVGLRPQYGSRIVGEVGNANGDEVVRCKIVKAMGRREGWTDTWSFDGEIK